MSAPQIVLRPVEAADKAQLRTWRNLPEISAWMYSDHEISEAEHERWFNAAMADPARKYWIIELDGRPVGLANLYDIAPAHRKCSWAYYLADPATRGKGVGAFVEFQVIEHVFADHGLNKLCCEVLIGNEAVWKLHESFGFRREALLRAHVWKHGQPLDVVGLGLLAEDWARVRPTSLVRLREKGFDLA
ncbi:MAG: UDP-4-amino-4,6-dideoxy-N-acetyl-beta-L-altrosamine N-acetyltransferase [Phenylobacterium sp.]|uniref:UDP-4-amino-4, 6-dideoxy-N-acetyl-beta-L-altrosamine N-acetyltransferase n=1 Tax=Phenylobacterium sp. TaxID=1871053 RepID=UPI001A269DF8|nr:UDP-4-amino-4,6-dideoxy-N-acetyl-beta-L-altrosamine N-acetyltransferase [Phenylobacterium sp.]MBJ7409256.1 UDP-4-amino-4,6-dideoxy-N-acetyl-beta-L-altrosamine N-acetyltransferase [Phenylobacterium sp.]